MAVLLQHKCKRLVLINVYRVPKTSSQGVYCSVTQYNKVDGKVKSPSQYRKELL